VHKRCLCVLLGVAVRQLTGSVLTRVGWPCDCQWTGIALVDLRARSGAVDSGHTPHYLDRCEICFELTRASLLSRVGYTCTAWTHSVRPRSVLDFGGLGRT
jgi:hypothetical protein